MNSATSGRPFSAKLRFASPRAGAEPDVPVGGRRGDVHVRDGLRPGREGGDAEAARVGEDVEDVASGGVGGDGRAVVALVEIEARLVAGADVHEVAAAVLGDFDRFRRLLAGEDARRGGEAFVLA